MGGQAIHYIRELFKRAVYLGGQAINRASVILLLRYVQEKILERCGNDECALKVIEEIKLRIEELSIEDVEKELFR